jgi:hypothetical protein
MFPEWRTVSKEIIIEQQTVAQLINELMQVCEVPFDEANISSESNEDYTSLYVMWSRPQTEQEAEGWAKAQATQKEYRRRQYELLRGEFDNANG